jgi:hypothetical protein
MALVLASSVEQARVVFSYVRGFLEASPVLAREVKALKRHEIELRNGVTIAVHSNSYRTVRGRTLVAAIFDETAFWRDESTATPDTEVYTAVQREYAALCRDYRVSSEIGDNYARDWVAGAWRKLGFEYNRSPQPKGTA